MPVPIWLVPLIKSNLTEADAESSLEADERANRYDVLSRLADDLAHEIKNPLNAIVVNLEVLRRRVQSGAPDKALERANVIEQEVRRVHSLVDELLQLLRPTKSTGMTPIAVDAVVQSLASAVQLQAKAARVTLQCDAESSLYAQIRVEPLKFALLNLLTYAIDEESGAAGGISVSARRSGGEICVAVTCSYAVLDADNEHIRHCARLMASAGGRMQALEPPASGVGSMVTLVMPPGKFV